MNLPTCAWFGIITASSIMGFLIWKCIGHYIGRAIWGQYRIIERKSYYGKKYIVQRKSFGWVDESRFDFDGGPGDFDTLKEAQDYVIFKRGIKEIEVGCLSERCECTTCSRNRKLSTVLQHI